MSTHTHPAPTPQDVQDYYANPPVPPPLDWSESLELTTKHKEDWQISLTLCLAATPHFATPLYELLSPDPEHHALFTDDVPIAATDGLALILNPKTFFEYDPGERLFIMSHEILHALLDHPRLVHMLSHQGYVPYPNGDRLPYHYGLANIALDYVVNAILIEGGIGRWRKDWLYEPSIITSQNTFSDAYRILWSQVPKIIIDLLGPETQGASQTGSNPPPPPNTSQPPNAPPRGSPVPPRPLLPYEQELLDKFRSGSFDQHLEPGVTQGKDPAQASAEKNDAKWRQVIDQAMDTARQQGLLPASLERALGRVLEPQVDWRDKLRSAVMRSISGDRWSWEIPEEEFIQRDIYVPSRSSYGAADVVVGCDISGSVSDAEISMFLAELVGIMEQIRPRRMFVAWCDADIDRVDELNDVSEIALLPHPKGGGGTSFVPVFEWVEARSQDLQLDGLIYLTDLAGTFPERKPDYPVVWGSVLPDKKAPFGEIVEIPRIGKARGRYGY